MPRPQFTLRALLVLMLVVASYFIGVAHSKREALDIRRESHLLREKLILEKQARLDLQKKLNSAVVELSETKKRPTNPEE